MQPNLPLKRHPKLSVALPASLVSDVPHLREKTSKIGFTGRALAIFRVDELIVFPDRLDQDRRRDANMIGTILSYMETPQYLRRCLFRIRPELQYVGVLPPLRTSHHPLGSRMRDLKIGEYREGAVVAADKKGVLVEVGVEKPIPVLNVRAPLNTRVTVKIIEDGRNPRGELADRDKIEAYWGFRVTVSDVPLWQLLKEKPFDLVIATSRRGDPFKDVADSLIAKWKRAKRVLLAFGSPTHGLQEIVMQEHGKLEEIADFVVNMVPNQATETVRTEEALYATLAAINLVTANKTGPNSMPQNPFGK